MTEDRRNKQMRTKTIWTRIAVCLLAVAAAYGETGARRMAAKDRGRQLAVLPDVDHVFPYLLSSGAWTSTLYLTNLEDREINVGCEFVGTNGEERPLQFSFSAADEPTGYTESRIAKFSTESFSTVSTATALTTAWVYCAAETQTDRFSGYVVVRNTASNGAAREFITPLQPDAEPVFSVPLSDTATSTTGLILVNTSLDAESNLGLWAFNRDGENVGTSTLTLPAGALRVVVLNEAFKELKSGTVRVVVVDGTKAVTGLALRTNAAGFAAFAPLAPREAPPAPPE
jgi:hypothetical protein